MEKMIRGWRVRAEGPGYVCFFDPSIEHVVLYEGPDLAYEVREGSEAGEDGLASAGIAVDGSGTLPLFPHSAGGTDEWQTDQEGEARAE